MFFPIDAPQDWGLTYLKNFRLLKNLSMNAHTELCCINHELVILILIFLKNY